VEEEDDIYGDGMGVDPDTIPPKYISLMVHCILKLLTTQQQVANREKDSITIELDDVNAV
jgi:hypothetical protein